MKHRALDRRNTGYGTFQYSVTFGNIHTVGTRREFCAVREWFIANFDMSCEYEFWHDMEASNQSWCWTNDQYRTTIYMRTDQEYTLFLLRWT